MKNRNIVRVIGTMAGIAFFCASCDGDKDDNYFIKTDIPSKSVGATDNSFNVEVSSNGSWVVTSDAGWALLGERSRASLVGFNDGTLSINVAENLLAEARVATIIFTAGDSECRVEIIQDGAGDYGGGVIIDPLDDQTVDEWP